MGCATYEDMFEKSFDEFFDKQPKPEFIDDLKKPIHKAKPENFGMRAAEPDEIDLRGMYLDIDFPDPNGVLETAFEDLEKFLSVYEIGGDLYRVTVTYEKSQTFEEYTVSVSENGCRITAGDTEGIRRALVRFEDMLNESEAPYLTARSETRRPVIKSRITRGFFSPTNRPPMNIDELWDDVDYYPDEYLNRLAHDGNNGIWIYTRFKDLIPSDIFPEYGTDSERR